MVFAEVARLQSFTAAAKQLKLSKSAVSQHVSRLETQIGMPVLKRHTRGMSLTALGAKLLERSETLAGQVDAALLDIASAEDEPEGEFSVTAPHSLETPVLVPAISNLTAEFPRLKPRMIVTDTVLDLMYDKIDVAIHVGNPKESNYKARRIGRIKEVFCASPNYLQVHGHPRSIDDLKKHRWISIDWQDRAFQLKDAINTDSTTTFDPFVQCNNLAGAIALAMHNMGIVLLPDITAQPLIQNGDLSIIATDVQLPSWQVYMMHPYKSGKPRHIARFQELIFHHFTKASPASSNLAGA